METVNKYAQIFDLSEKTAIVTGGYGHLGSGIVRALLAFNADVVVAGRSIEKYEAVFSEAERKNLSFEQIDITNSQSIANCFEVVVEKYGTIDILINNAHTAKGNSPENMNDEDWAYTMDGVVGSVHKAIREIMPVMKNQGFGKIVNIASMYGLVSPDFRLYEDDNCEMYRNPPHYGAAKAAMIQLTKYYAALLAKYNIQVNAVSPGPFPKAKIQTDNPLFVERLKKKNPMNKIGEPVDLAGVIVLLSSRGSSFITGQTLQVDGGWTIW
ncbi:MAG TPA: SDR family oxidoreductase [Bacteroidales bacterium]|nr:SDR family oxidoreductase [Bacteroidales bacterium]